MKVKKAVSEWRGSCLIGPGRVTKLKKKHKLRPLLFSDLAIQIAICIASQRERDCYVQSEWRRLQWSVVRSASCTLESTFF